MKIVNFIKGSYEELITKVSWSKYSELQSNSFLVIIASIIFAMVIGVMDLGFDRILNWFYQTF